MDPPADSVGEQKMQTPGPVDVEPAPPPTEESSLPVGSSDAAPSSSSPAALTVPVASSEQPVAESPFTESSSHAAELASASASALSGPTVADVPDASATDAGVPEDNGEAADVEPPVVEQHDTAEEASVAAAENKESESEVKPASSSKATIGPTPKGRLPHDILGQLEDRVKEDPRGDLDAWLSLIDEHKKRGKLETARSVYERCLAVFPFAASIWLSYAQMENEAQDRHAVDNVLGKSLMQVPDLGLWSFYLDHVRRHNNLTTDTTGAARQTINSAYDLALKQVGIDKDSGPMWLDYLAFIKSGPGMVGGSSWQDQQKMDSMRKAYQRAICVPSQATNALWKEYDAFEMGLNKITGRKFLQDQSPAYMSARSSYTELQNITRSLDRSSLPVLPPIMGCEGDTEYLGQLTIWKQWIAWERSDPLVLAKDDPECFKNRILFVYRHALMAMRFWPELWYEASEFCFANDLDDPGHDCLIDGMLANPESCLLAFRRADRLEMSTVEEEGDDKISQRATSVKEPFDQLLSALYHLIIKVKTNEERDVARIEAQFTSMEQEDPNDDEAKKFRDNQKSAQIETLRATNAVQTRLLSQTISSAWIALMRSLRRVQGKGGVDQGGARGTFQEARRRGRITSDVYVEAALIEFHCYDPDTGTKIFERGLKLFQEDERFALEYIKHLVATNDHTNARVVFETVATRLSQKPDTVTKAKPLYAFFHDFESRYGELSQIVKLEQRMQDLFPEDPALRLFSQRFVDTDFDPTAIRLVVSPAKQSRLKSLAAVAEQAAVVATNGIQLPKQSPAPPKRPLDVEDSGEASIDRPRKVVRGQSPARPNGSMPLTGPATISQVVRPSVPPAPSHHIKVPPPLPRDVTFLLSIIPKAPTYQATKFDPEKMVKLIRETSVPTSLGQTPRGPQPNSYPPAMPAPTTPHYPPAQTQQQFQPPMSAPGYPMPYPNAVPPAMPGYGMPPGPQPYGGMPMSMGPRPGMAMPGPMGPGMPMGYFGGQPMPYGYPR